MIEDALRHHQAGRLAEAEAIYRQILAVNACDPDCLHLLGMIEHQRGNHEFAVSIIRQAIAVRPDEAAYHSNLGIVFHTQGKLDQAASCFERALALKPGWAEVHINLGNIRQLQGRLGEAAACQQRALILEPECAEAYCNLGNIRQAERKLPEAVALFEQALAIKPDYVNAHNNLGTALLEQDKVDEAVAHFERALARLPDFAAAHNNLGCALSRQDRPEEAKAHYERAVILKPDYPNAYHNLGNIFVEEGRFQEAMEHFDQAIALKPDYGEAHLNRAAIKSFQPGGVDLAALEALASSDDFPEDTALYVHFALAKALDDVGDYVRAFEHLRKGNALKRRRIDYDETSELKLFQRISAVFDSGLIDRLQGLGDPSPIPIFVLGMPRSGSTLIEQILASHPQIHAAGELTIFEKMEVNGELNGEDPPLPYPESVAVIDGVSLRRLGRSYLSRLPKAANRDVRIVNKLPGNFLRAGLIRLILPNAKIIHVSRDPLDTCLSCFSKLFTYGLYFSYDLAELGRYYGAYIKLMAHWRSVLSTGAMLEVVYEDVVNDLEGQARRLIDYCGLPWDDRCLSFHKTSRRVRTASAFQVHQPLFSSSLQRWRHYEVGLGPVLDELRSVLGRDRK